MNDHQTPAGNQLHDRFTPAPKPVATPKKKPEPIKKVSKKQQSRNARYAKAKREYLTEHPKCQVCNIRLASDIHHRRGRVGDLLCDKSYFLAVDRMCHQKIELNPVWAKENGYSENRLEVDDMENYLK